MRLVLSGDCPDPCRGGILLSMRVNLITHSSGPYRPGDETIALSLTIKPACGQHGDYVCPTDSAALLRMLNLQSDLPSAVLRRFHGEIQTSSDASLLGVDLSDGLLTEMGYFVD
jgi:hypothetical protein